MDSGQVTDALGRDLLSGFGHSSSLTLPAVEPLENAVFCLFVFFFCFCFFPKFWVSSPNWQELISVARACFFYGYRNFIFSPRRFPL